MLAMEFAAVTTQAANQEGKYLRQAGKMKRLLFLLGLLLTQPCLAHDAKRETMVRNTGSVVVHVEIPRLCVLDDLLLIEQMAAEFCGRYIEIPSTRS